MTTITAKILAHSFNPETSSEVVTFECEYPLVIHAHVLTHRVFSRNTASQRAIPVKTMIRAVKDNPYIPLTWGKNQPGMVAKDEEVDNPEEAMKAWLDARDLAVMQAERLDRLGLHKQHTNRLLAPWQHTKVILTTSDLENFFNLRLGSDAQPEVQALATAMQAAYAASTAKFLYKGDWHLPYIDKNEGKYFYADQEVTLEQAKAISVACCAAVSYRAEGMTLEKALAIYDKLGVGTEHFHASPFEHVCTPWTMDQEVELGNLEGFHQLRHILSDEYLEESLK